MLHLEFIKKYFNHPKHLIKTTHCHIDKACCELEKGGDWKYELACIHTMLTDFFKTDGVIPETYIAAAKKMRER